MKKLLLLLLLTNIIFIPNVYSNEDNNNTHTGIAAGGSLTTGTDNTFTGKGTGWQTDVGDDNTATGRKALYLNESGNENTSIGSNSGYSNVSGSGNVFLGYKAGYNETGSNTLYIDNSDTTTPLIYGDFNLDLLKIYGDLEVTGSLTSTEVSDNADNISINTTNITTNTNDISTINTNIGDRTYTDQNYVTDGESLTSSINSLDQQVGKNYKRLDDHEGRISDLEETEINLMGEVQFIRGKNHTVSTYAKYDVRHSSVPEVGLKLTVGLGKSWTQEELERLEIKLNKIEKLLQKVAGKRELIETKMIKTNNGYSIVINEGDTVKLLKKF